MIRANLRLVVKIAQDYSGYGLPVADLISEGNIGLMKAVERFDPEKGGKLSTYAAWWIKQSIKRALANQSKTIRLPVHAGDTLARLQKARAGLELKLGRPATLADAPALAALGAETFIAAFGHLYTPEDLAAFLEQVTAMFEPQAAMKGLALRLDLPPTLPEYVRTDPKRLRQVLEG
jgi:RNA polymerase sigma factor (sigma-70 family)